MPIIEVTLVEGRDDALKKELVTELTDATVRAVKCPKETVRIIIREIPPEHFAAGGVRKSESAPKASTD